MAGRLGGARRGLRSRTESYVRSIRHMDGLHDHKPAPTAASTVWASSHFHISSHIVRERSMRVSDIACNLAKLRQSCLHHVIPRRIAHYRRTRRTAKPTSRSNRVLPFGRNPSRQMSAGWLSQRDCCVSQRARVHFPAGWAHLSFPAIAACGGRLGRAWWCRWMVNWWHIDLLHGGAVSFNERYPSFLICK